MEPRENFDKFAKETEGMNPVDFMKRIFPWAYKEEKKYTEADMIAFAKRFLPHCKSGIVTDYQLILFNKEREYNGPAEDSM